MSDAELANEMRKNLERELRQGLARGVQKAAQHLVNECAKLASVDQPKEPIYETVRIKVGNKWYEERRQKISRYGSLMWRQKQNATKGAPMRRLSGDNVKQYEYEMGGEMYSQILGLPGKKIQARVGTNVVSTPETYHYGDPEKKRRRSDRQNPPFPYSAHHEAHDHPVIGPTVESHLEELGNLIVSGLG